MFAVLRFPCNLCSLKQVEGNTHSPAQIPRIFASLKTNKQIRQTFLFNSGVCSTRKKTFSFLHIWERIRRSRFLVIYIFVTIFARFLFLVFKKKYIYIVPYGIKEPQTDNLSRLSLHDMILPQLAYHIFREFLLCGKKGKNATCSLLNSCTTYIKLLMNRL